MTMYLLKMKVENSANVSWELMFATSGYKSVPEALEQLEWYTKSVFNKEGRYINFTLLDIIEVPGTGSNIEREEKMIENFGAIVINKEFLYWTSRFV